ncbi:hypothetical protein JQX13_04105 [Archangium violaceum]|uniref:hypothetical protein n=1 Tax=Archangium violaceum TaxID=83451 RepID=UPI00193BFF43|nr:hypothetical protein [Archangium violaceum]QRK09339.1 hypothetical protein JQX13_04105 [Archangium violaceum]
MHSLSPAAPLQVFSIHFQHPNSQAIPLRDPWSELFLGASPEWIIERRNEPAAYVRGTRPTLLVEFFTDYDCPSEVEVSAYGHWQEVAEPSESLPPEEGDGEPLIRPTPLKLDDYRAKMTSPIKLVFARELPDRIGKHSLSLFWFASWNEKEAGPRRVLIGVTTHILCTTWRRMLTNEEEELTDWAYTPLVLWTSEWCAGLDGEKEICDALIKNIPRTNLQYGIPGWSVRYMLLHGGGMCGGWFIMFQHMAHCQGVYVERRCFYTPWKVVSRSQVHWAAMVVTRGGINQPAPSDRAGIYGLWRDEPALQPVQQELGFIPVKARRYCFWGSPDGLSDGHCINFLQVGQRLYLYDSCFHRMGIEVQMELPPKDLTRLPPEQELAFRDAYLNQTLGFIMGSLIVDGKLYVADPARNELGITVPPQLIPELDILWGP